MSPQKNLWFPAVLVLVVGLLAGVLSIRAVARQPDPEPADPDPKIWIRAQAQMDAFEAARHGPRDLAARGLTPCVGGFAGPYPCDQIDLMSFVPLSDFSGANSTNDIWGWTDPLDGSEYAILGLDTGTAFIDVSNPVAPVYLGRLPTQTANSIWRDIKVYQNHAFVVSEAANHGMQVFDLTRLRSVVSPPVIFTTDAHYNGFGSAHNVAINEDSGFAYGVGTGTCSGGLHMVDISTPTSPSNAGCFSSDGYTHDAQCVIYNGPDASYSGNEICFNSNEDTLTIVDVTNKASPVQLSRTGYAGSGYTHQGWLTEDHSYFLLSDELDETTFGHNTRTRIWDVTDLDFAAVIGIYDGPNASIDHNLYILNGYVYESNYTSGLQILNASDVSNGNLSQLAFFDTYTPSNAASYDGTWSNYPYFDSGIVVVSGIDEGLFVLQPTLPADFALQTTDANLEICTPGSDTTTVSITGLGGYSGDVTLSSIGLPAGAADSFTPNPVAVPGSSLLEVTAAGTSPGNYPFMVRGTDGSLTHDLNMNLDVFETVPGISTLTSPADGAVDVSPSPTFTWTAASQASSYDLEVADDPGFSSIVYSASGIIGTSHAAASPLDGLTTYYWRVRANNACGGGSYSAVFSFTTADIPAILLVDDDDNDPDVRGTYTSALDNLGLGYDVWDTGNSDSNEPSVLDLAPYDMVIWFSGDEFSVGGGTAGPGAAGEAALASWLDDGGCLFISSQDYHYDKGLTTFMQSYLGVASVTDDDGNYVSVSGQGSVFGGLGPFSLNYPFTDFSDIVAPNGTAELAYQGNNGNGAAVNKDGGSYRTTYWAFPWEAISMAADRQTNLDTFVTWCQALPGATDTPTPTPTASATATPTHTPTATSTPTATPDPFSHDLHLPIIQQPAGSAR